MNETEKRAIDDLRKLATIATPGPWWINEASRTICEETRGEYIAEMGNLGHPGVRRDAEYICAANPTAILALLDSLDVAVRLADALARHVATVTAERDTAREELVAVTRERDYLRDRVGEAADALIGALDEYDAARRNR